MDAASVEREMTHITLNMERSPFNNRCASNIQTKRFIRFLVTVASGFAILGCPFIDGNRAFSADAAESSIRRRRAADADLTSRNSEHISLLEQPSLEKELVRNVRRQRQLGKKAGKKSSSSSVAGASSYGKGKGGSVSSSSSGPYGVASSSSTGKGKGKGGSTSSSYGSYGSVGSLEAASSSTSYVGKKGKKSGSGSSTGSLNAGSNSGSTVGSMSAGSMSTYGGKKGKKQASGSSVGSMSAGPASGSSVGSMSAGPASGSSVGSMSGGSATGSSAGSWSSSGSGSSSSISASTGTAYSSSSWSSSASGSSSSISASTGTGSAIESSSGSGSDKNINVVPDSGMSSGTPINSESSLGISVGDAPGILAGQVFIDTNLDGIVNLGESGIPEVEIIITDSAQDTHTVITDANGKYSIALPSGAAIVDISDTTLPSGMVPTGSSVPTDVTVPAGDTATVRDGFQLMGMVEGIVWEDTNADGKVDGNEPGLSGVQVVITDAHNKKYTVITDSNGHYKQPVPAGATTIDIVDGTVSSNYVRSFGTDPTVVIVPGGGTASDLDGFYRKGMVEGIVWEDTNANGKVDSNEPGLSGVQVVITDAHNKKYTVITDSNGHYKQPVPAGATTIDIVDGTISSDYVRSFGTDPTVVIVPGGGTASDLDGFHAKGMVEGIVWEDTNANGKVDSNEPGLSGVQVVITDAHNKKYTVITDSNGHYKQPVPAGATTIDIVDGTVSSDYVRSFGTDPTVVIVPGGGTASDLDGFTPVKGVIKGSVFNDADGDGVQDSAETGISGVKVVITDSQQITHTVITDVNGDYSLLVSPGDATIDIPKSSVPAGMVPTGSSVPTDVTVPAGGTATDLDGFYAKGMVEGIVWEDTNADGKVDSNEPGLSGVQVVITDAHNKKYTVITDSNGHYKQPVPAGATTIDIVDGTVSSDYVRSFGTDPTVVIVPGGGTASDLDGFTPVKGVIKGSVFNDADGDGVQDSAETGISGVKVVITDSQQITHTVITDVNGDYSLLVSPGDATIDIPKSSVPAGMVPTGSSVPTDVTVPAGGTATDLDGFYAKGMVEGIVWEDTNADGKVDSNEPGLSGVQVVITDAHNKKYTVITDSNGHYKQPVPAGATTIDIVDGTVSSDYVRSFGTDPTVVIVPGGGTASDLDGFTPSSTFDPQLNTFSPATVAEEYSETVTLKENDGTDSPTSEDVTYEMLDGPEWLTLTPEGQFQGTPTLMDVGVSDCTLIVKSPLGSVTVTEPITVVNVMNAGVEEDIGGPTLPPSGRSVFELTEDALGHVDRAYDKFLEDRKRLLEEEARRKLSATKSTVVAYAGPVSLDRKKGKNDMYLRHFDYFLEHGVDCRFHDTVIVLSQETRDVYEAQLANENQKCELMGHKIIVLTRQDRCYDMEAMRVILEEVDLSGYDEFVYLNCGVVGPKLPADHDPNVSWTSQYTRLLNDDVKMSGLSMNCLSHPHIQSMVFAVDQKGLQIIKNSGAVYDCGQHGSTEFSVELQFEIIKRYEIGMSRAIMDAGYSLAATMSTRGEMQIDPRDLVLDTMTWCYDVWHPQALHNLGGGLAPKWEELVFFKASRLIPFEIYDELKYADPHLEPTEDFYYFETGPDTRDLTKGLDILLGTSEDSED